MYNLKNIAVIEKFTALSLLKKIMTTIGDAGLKIINGKVYILVHCYNTIKGFVRVYRICEDYTIYL